MSYHEELVQSQKQENPAGRPGNSSQRNRGKEAETQVRMEHQGPRPEKDKNKGLIPRPGALRGRCTIRRS